MNVKLTAKQKIRVLNSLDVYNIMQQILLRENKIDRNKEHFWIVCLSTNNSILMIELISLGSVSGTVVEAIDIFSFALQKRAVKLILVHNHPSGEMQASAADIEITERMFAIGKFINMPVLDHLIISEKRYMSFADEEMISKMEKDNRFDLTFSQVDKLTKELKGMEKKKATEMAKKMLEKGKYDNKEIAELTGLTVKQVEKLAKEK